ncbi:MAG TPA: hypothetical protein VFH28_08795 [Nitrososphaera sp.]|nr:hypothetical protein [Nitrososphaera sp.]
MKIKPEKLTGITIHPAFLFLAYRPWGKSPFGLASNASQYTFTLVGKKTAEWIWITRIIF